MTQELLNTAVKIIPLGGLGEVGKNTWILCIGDDWVIIDAGLGFSFGEFPGVELLFPSLDYILENKDKIKALIITHAHEDHIGGTVRLFSNIEVPIIHGPPLALTIIEKKLSELNVNSSAVFNKVQPRDKVTIGSFSVEFIRTTHSVPDCFALCFETKVGKILFTGDFKFDFTPVDNDHFDIPRLVELGNEGIKLLISDSTNVEREGFGVTESSVGPNLLRVFKEAPKRIFLGTFSSHIHRIQQAIDAAIATNRKVCLFGYSMELFAEMARNTGHLKYPDDVLLSINDILALPENETVIITSGSQGEDSSTFARMAKREHKTLQVIPGDTFVFSAHPIPGNERAVSKIMDQLSEQGAYLVYGRKEGIHASGHACQEELKLMLALTRPEHFMPAHGDYRMLVNHAEIAAKMGIDPAKIYILSNGDVLEISKDRGIVHKEVVDCPIVYYDSISGGIVDQQSLKERDLMGNEGLVLLFIVLNAKTEELISLDVDFKGISLKDNHTQEKVKEVITSEIMSAYKRMKQFGTADEQNLKLISHTCAGKIAAKSFHCSPMVLVLAQQVDPSS